LSTHTIMNILDNFKKLIIDNKEFIEKKYKIKIIQIQNKNKKIL